MARSATLDDISNRRADIEKFLNECGVRSFTYREEVPVSEFDLDRSLRNQARIAKPVDEAVVRRYVRNLDNGDVFPPVIAHRSRGKLLVLDGNHRLRAHQVAKCDLDVYEVEAPPQVLVMIAFEANARHGLPSSHADLMHHGVYLVDGGVPIAEAARRLGLSEVSLSRQMSAVRADQRAADAGVPERIWDSFPATKRGRVAMVSTNEGLRAFSELVYDAQLSVDKVAEMVPALNDLRSSERQVQAIKELRQALSEQIVEVRTGGGSTQGHRAGGNGPRGRLGLALGQVRALASTAWDTALGDLPETAAAELMEKVDTSLEVLVAIRKVLEGRV